MKQLLTAAIDAAINWIRSRAGKDADFAISEWWEKTTRRFNERFNRR